MTADSLATGTGARYEGRFSIGRLGRWIAGDVLGRWVISIMLISTFVLVVLPLVTTKSPTATDSNAVLAGPSLNHWFGTDQLGRDVAVRILYGARLSLLVAVVSAVAALVCGAALGAVSVVGPKWLGETIMRLTDVGLAFPGVLLAIVLAAAIGPSLTTTVIVLAIIYTPSMTRVVRAALFAEYGEDYVTAARLIGTKRVRLVGYHIGSNAAGPILVYFTVVMADAIVAEAALSFIGAGIKPPAPSWGNIIHDGQGVIDTGAWWVTVMPGLFIVATVLTINRFSEAIGRRLRSR